MTWRIMKRRTRLDIVRGILLVGLTSAVTVFFTAGTPPPTPWATPRTIPRSTAAPWRWYGGQANLVASDITDWITGLWHGRTLAYTLAVLTLLLAWGFSSSPRTAAVQTSSWPCVPAGGHGRFGILDPASRSSVAHSTRSTSSRQRVRTPCRSSTGTARRLSTRVRSSGMPRRTTRKAAARPVTRSTRRVPAGSCHFRRGTPPGRTAGAASASRWRTAPPPPRSRRRVRGAGRSSSPLTGGGAASGPSAGARRSRPRPGAGGRAGGT